MTITEVSPRLPHSPAPTRRRLRPHLDRSATSNDPKVGGPYERGMGSVGVERRKGHGELAQPTRRLRF